MEQTLCPTERFILPIRFECREIKALAVLVVTPPLDMTTSRLLAARMYRCTPRRSGLCCGFKTIEVNEAQPFCLASASSLKILDYHSYLESFLKLPHAGNRAILVDILLNIIIVFR